MQIQQMLNFLEADTTYENEGIKMITHVIRTPLAGAIAVASAFSAPAALSLEDEPSMVLEEMVVTARRRQESLQEVPLSISVMSGDQLERIGAADIIDFTLIILII